MFLRRLYQFMIVYGLALLLLLAIKFFFGLSDYVIPGPREIWHTAGRVSGRYALDVLNTLQVAVLGHALSIAMAFAVGIVGRLTSWMGSMIKTAAFNIQAYPIVAVAPIIFILLGDGFSSRLLIAAMICYFPLLLSILGILSEPVEDIEHFFRMTGRITWHLEVRIRAFENLHKLTTVIVGSATLAVVGTIVAEFIAASAGIGVSIRRALYQSDLSKILVALFLIGICTSLYLACLEWGGRRLMRRWQAPAA